MRRSVTIRFVVLVGPWLAWFLGTCSGCAFETDYVADSTVLLSEADWDVKHLLTHRAYSVRFSPDSKRFVATGPAGQISVFDTETGEVLALWTIEGPDDYVVRSLSAGSQRFSPDGRWIVAAVDAPGLSVWDAETFGQVASVNSETVECDTIYWSPDSAKLVSTHFDIVRVWDAATLKPLAKLEGHTEPLTDAQFSPDGNSIVSVGWDKTVRVWDAATYNELAVLWQNPDRIMCMSFSPDGKYLATGGIVAGNDRRVLLLWDFPKREVIRRFRHNYDIESVSFREGGRQLESRDRYRLRVWDTSSGRRLADVGPEGHFLDRGVIATNRRYIVTMHQFGRTDQQLKVWERKQKEGDE